MSEFQPKQEQRELNRGELEAIANERNRELHEQLERKSPERRNGSELEGARHETEAALKGHEKMAKPQERRQSSEIQRQPTKRDKTAKYDAIMADTRQYMSPAGRSFSKVIHHPVIEKTSEFGAKTIARPNAILAGSMTAFALVLIIYMLARHYGYPLSGTETIVAFVLGWVIGLIFDYFKAMYTGGRNL